MIGDLESELSDFKAWRSDKKDFFNWIIEMPYFNFKG